jgi:hypothetical protein
MDESGLPHGKKIEKRIHLKFSENLFDFFMKDSG